MPYAIQIQRNGGPEVMQVVDENEKSPLDDEVLIAQTAVGLNFIDVYHRTGLYPLPL